MSTVRIIPLGGLGEVGKNVMVIEDHESMILVDCGLTFPRDEGIFGVDIVIPDLSYVKANAHKLAGVVLTHGHEDHIGALPSLLRAVDVPQVWGTRFTMALVKSRADEQGLIGATEWCEIDPEAGAFELGNFEIEPFRVSHSIPDCVGLAVHTSEGTIVHTGDIKLDTTPLDGVRTDLGALAEIAADGVALYLADSTNADIPGSTPSERSVAGPLRDVIRGAHGRVFASTFSSQIHRIQQIMDIARDTGRSVCILGRSMLRNTNIARNLGYLDANGVDIVKPHEIEDIPPSRLLLLSTGSQGEPLAAMSRIAAGTHPRVEPRPDDTVIFSSRTIPGNEVRVHHVVNLLSRQGAHIFHDRNSRVHVSGHASSEELTLLLGVVRPQHFMPVHGEWRHLRAHADLARVTGVDGSNIIMGENGHVIELRAGKARITDERVPVGVHLVDRQTNQDIDDNVLDDRQQLSSGGVVVAIARPAGVGFEVEIVPRGLAVPDIDDTSDRVRQAAMEAVDEAALGGGDADALETALERIVTAGFEDELGIRPLVVAVIESRDAAAAKGI